MTLNIIAVAFVVITLITMITVGFFMYIMEKRSKNPARCKSIKRVSEWTDIDPSNGNPIKRTQTEFFRVRV